MVQIIGFQKRTNQEGEDYFAIQVQSQEIEFQVSKTTGRPYATLRKCWINSTFDEPTCEALLGKQLKGSIIKEASEPYTFIIEETGEEIELNFRYTYINVENFELDTVNEFIPQQ